MKRDKPPYIVRFDSEHFAATLKFRWYIGQRGTRRPHAMYSEYFTSRWEANQLRDEMNEAWAEMAAQQLPRNRVDYV